MLKSKTAFFEVSRNADSNILITDLPAIRLSKEQTGMYFFSLSSFFFPFKFF